MNGHALGFTLFALSMVSPAYAADATPLVRIETNMGDIVLKLNPEKAPKTVANFLRYVDEGLYDNTIFHRVIASFMIQGGGYFSDQKQPKSYSSVENESKNGLSNKRGTIAMARTNEPHSATNQFFINVVDNNFLDGNSPQARGGWGYAVFGEVIEGMDTVDKIRKVRTAPGAFGDDVPVETILIKKVGRVNAAPATP